MTSLHDAGSRSSTVGSRPGRVPELHRSQSPTRPLRFVVITVSTSRYHARKGRKKAPDKSGDLAQELIERRGGTVARRDLLPDSAARIEASVLRALKSADVDAVVLTGGTGISTTDVTIETVRPLLAKEIEGFGEIFRSVGFGRIGFAAALSRATAGVANGKAVVALPGSPDGVKTGLELILGELPHVLHLAAGQRELS
ncbi:MAG: MogA/MoaB family molybdenum cofactor biosynthesis protein [Nitrososphaerota archaeon]|nr:MogA/MoaB family molybdenum cofactor biosynthesis protein [Nitrososphaerota archaeon]MDG6979320.1 MogA/MoaB family molybdenum cofactor biosynthesis protein [Nitrososphaerota archaeon]